MDTVCNRRSTSAASVLTTVVVVLAFVGSGQAEPIRYVERGSTWRYFRGQSEASSPDPAAWRLPDYDDGGWDEGPAPFGYGDPPFGVDLSGLAPPMEDNYSSLFLRQTFELTRPGAVVQLELGADYDDGFILWINGVELLRANFGGQAGDPVAYDDFAAAQHESGSYETFALPAPDGYLRAGINVVAVMVFNNQISSSDLKLDLELIDPIGVDLSPPAVAMLVPAAGVTVRALAQIEVTFNEDVRGVEATDLVVDGTPAAAVAGAGRGPYVFTLPPRAPGAVAVEWASDHGIEDLAEEPNAFAGGSWSYTVDPEAPAGNLAINEIMAANLNGLRDEDGDRPDWIEIVNRGTEVVDVAGWSLTDDPEEPGKYVLPSRALGPDEYLLVFASGKDRSPGSGNLHASFQLGADGEYVGLYGPDSPRRVVSELAPRFPVQRPDIAYGRDGTGGLSYFDDPTPGAPNNLAAVLAGVVTDPRFSAQRGFYFASLDLEITCDTPGADIRYRLDGGEPTPSNGTVYAGPVRIAASAGRAAVTVRAVAYRSGYLPSDVVTHTYIFPEHVPSQPDRPSGFPGSWGSAPSVDYGMDPEVVGDTRYRDRIVPALLEIPTISMVGKTSDIFALYSNAGGTGVSWERGVSVEMLHTDGKDGFQVNCGVRIQGGASRNANKSPKHSWRLLFKGDYGPTKLRYPLFPDSPVESFDQLILRAGYNNSWIHWDSGQRRRAQYIRDQWVRDTLRDMGQVSSHGLFVHLYINGLYWGLYNLVERPNAAFAASYAGGEKEEYDALNSGQAKDGNTRAYSEMMSFANTGLASDDRYLEIEARYLDVSNLIDYMLANYFGGNDDWPGHNWYAARRRVAGGQYMFFSWDAERIFESVNRSRVGADANNSPGRLFERLRANAEFRLRVADHVERHFFNGGALTPSEVTERWEVRARGIANAVVAESARWGDYRRDVHSSSNGPYEFYRPHTHWDPERDRLNDDYFPQRSEVVLSQLRSAGLYPAVGAPELSRVSGNVASGYELELDLPAGTSGRIYYTVNGGDPREFGGGVSEEAQEYSEGIRIEHGAVVRARVQSGTRWSALTEGVYSVPSYYAGLVVSELMYNPVGGPEFEFVELWNSGGTALDLTGVSFVEGIRYDFAPGRVLGAGEYVVLVSKGEKFGQRYAGVSYEGEYAGTLDNGGERLTLVDILGNEVLSFRYDDAGGWPIAADGFGRSLLLVDVGGRAGDWRSWRASTEYHGQPGSPNASPHAGGVVVNEVLARSEAPYEDAIELLNERGDAIDIGGWYLSDDRSDERSLKKYRIPEGTVIPGGGYAVFYEGEFNPSPGEGTSFALSGGGEGVYLSAAEAGFLESYITGVEFSGASENVSLGRVETSRGADFTALAEPTFGVSGAGSVEEFRAGGGAANAAALVGPVVVNEIHYNPASGGVEFVELYNVTGEVVSLWDGESGRGWRLRGVSAADGEGSYEFGRGAEIEGFGFVLVVGTTPDLFRYRRPVPAGVPVYQYGGALDNGGERLRLEYPRVDGEGGEVWWVEVDRVEYDDEFPWPPEADGGGASLERREPEGYGNEALNWGSSRRAGGTPGESNSVGPPPPNRAPTASIVALPERGAAPLEVRLDGSGSRDPEGQIVSYRWEYGDGSSGTGKVVTHRYEGVGEYEVRLEVEDGGGLKGEARVTVVVEENEAPSAWFTLDPESGLAPLEVEVDGSASSDPEGEIVSYRWDFGDGGSGEGQVARHTYTREGVYGIVLEVEDGGGLVARARREVTVGENESPVAEFTVEVGAGGSPLRVRLDGSGSRDGDGDELSYSWDFGDGSQGAGVVVEHEYARGGEYTVILSVSDGRGGITAAFRLLEVTSGGLQRPGDCNQDGGLDISDAVCVLGHLFLGTPARLPCGDGTVGAAGNRALLDGNGDEGVDLTDAVYVLSYLFQGGPPPTAGLECLAIPECPSICVQ